MSRSMNLKEALLSAADNATIHRDFKVNIGYLSDEIVRRAIALQNAVVSFKRHPSMNTRAQLKAEANALTGAFSISMKMIGFRELPDAEMAISIYNVRAEVNKARDAVASLYKKKEK